MKVCLGLMTGSGVAPFSCPRRFEMTVTSSIKAAISLALLLVKIIKDNISRSIESRKRESGFLQLSPDFINDENPGAHSRGTGLIENTSRPRKKFKCILTGDSSPMPKRGICENLLFVRYLKVSVNMISWSELPREVFSLLKNPSLVISANSLSISERHEY
jgi:hypothetical protein